MGFFSFTQELAMDLGTANTIITSGDEIVVDEPSVVALDQQQRMIAVGNKDQQQDSGYSTIERWCYCRFLCL